jgi:hypothetical protein
MRAVTYQIRFLGPTNHKGARWHVTRLTDRVRRTAPYNYALGDSSAGKIHAIVEAFPSDTTAHRRKMLWSGAKGLSTYYTAILEEGNER